MIIKKAAYLISSATVDQCPTPDRPEYAFIGRSNVGKSSLINMLCNNQKLAKTSATPGKTQLINHFEILSTSGHPVSTPPLSTRRKSREVAVTLLSTRGEGKGVREWYLADLPGYGFAKTSQSGRRRWQQMIENYLRKRENLTNVFLLIDSRHIPQKIDLEFTNQLGEWQVPFTLTFTKADKEKPGAVERNVKAFLDAMLLTWQFLPQHFVTSALNKQGQQEILNYIEDANSAFKN